MAELNSWNCNTTLKNSDFFLTSASDCHFLLRPNIENVTIPKMADPSLVYVRFRDLSRFWIQRVFVPIISFIGIVGNLLTIVIMTRRQMRSSTNNYLAALAVFDMLYLFCIFILSIAHYPGLTDPHYINYWRLWPFALLLTDACSNTSVWLTVTFTVERYFAVCHPIKRRVYCTVSRAQKVVIIVALICCCLTLPTPFEWTIIEVSDPLTNKTSVQPTFSEFGMNVLYKNIYYWLCVFVFVFIPLILLTIFNSFLVRSVHASSIKRNTMTRRRNNRDSTHQESKITIMLIAVVVLFMVCQIPTAVLLVYTNFHPQNAITRGLGNIFNFLMAINSAGNFVLYCLFSQKYRRTFLHIFFPCFKTRLVRLRMDFQTTSYSNVDETANMPRNISMRMSTHVTSSIKRGINSKIGSYCGKKHYRRRRSNLQYQTSENRHDPTERVNDLSYKNRRRNNQDSMKFCSFFHQRRWHNVSENKEITQEERGEQYVPLRNGKYTICLTRTDGMLSHCVHSVV